MEYFKSKCNLFTISQVVLEPQCPNLLCTILVPQTGSAFPPAKGLVPGLERLLHNCSVNGEYVHTCHTWAAALSFVHIPNHLAIVLLLTGVYLIQSRLFCAIVASIPLSPAVSGQINGHGFMC